MSLLSLPNYELATAPRPSKQPLSRILRKCGAKATSKVALVQKAELRGVYTVEIAPPARSISSNLSSSLWIQSQTFVVGLALTPGRHRVLSTHYYYCRNLKPEALILVNTVMDTHRNTVGVVAVEI